MSEPAHKSLAEALSAFQAEAPTIHKSAEANAGSYSYKYADLADIVELIRPIMGKHGLSFSAFPCIQDGKPALRYVLRHAGGDVESEVMSLMVSKTDAQAHGSAITYARRYALCAVLNIAADKDDDGAAAKAAAERQAADRQHVAEGPSEPRSRPEQRQLIRTAAERADLPPIDLANAIRMAAGLEPREFDSQDHARQWAARQLENLPAHMVDLVLAEISQLAARVIG